MFIDRQVPKTTEENKIGRFTPFRSLWLTEDAQWLANRKVEWEAVKENIFSNVSREYHAPAQEIQILARFFLFGEEPEIKTLADSKKRISPQRRIALTPTKTSDELARLFFLLPPDSRDVNYFHSFLSRIYKSYYGFDCLRDRCRLFIDSVCGNTWQLYEELPYLNYKGSRLQETSESASLVAIHLISGARAILEAWTVNAHLDDMT